MSEVYAWSASAGGNTAAPPDGAPEGMARPGVNDCMREIMASVRRWYQGLDWTRPHGSPTTTRDTSQVVRLAGADYTSFFTAGRRIRVSGGGNREGFVLSSAYSAPDTLVTVRLEPTSRAQLNAGINVTFADVNPDTITAASGTPFSGLAAGDRIRIEKDAASALNSGTKLVGSIGGGGSSITLDAAETLSNEGPIAAKIYPEAVGVPVGTNLLELAHWSTSQAGHRDVGIAAGQLPSSDMLGGAAFKNEGSGKGLDADSVDTKHYTDIQADSRSLESPRNVLVNGGFRRWQRGTTFTNAADASYTADCWKALVQTATGVTITKDTTEKPTGARASIKMVSNAAGGKFGLVQFVEAEDCAHLINQTCIASVYLKADSSIANARLLLVSWTSTEDGILAAAPDVISTWNAAGNNPTMAANVTIEATSQIAVTTSWVRYTLSGTFAAGSAKNVGILILVDDDAITVAHALWISQAQLELGSVVSTFEHEHWSRLDARTSRFYVKTFPEATAPVDNAGLTGALRQGAGSSGSFPRYTVIWNFPVTMFDGSTPTVTYYNPSNASPAGKFWRDIDSPADRTAGTETVSSRLLCVNNGEAFSTDKRHAIHATVEASLF